LERWYSVEHPMIPPPITTTLAWEGRGAVAIIFISLTIRVSYVSLKYNFVMNATTL